MWACVNVLMFISFTKLYLSIQKIIQLKTVFFQVQKSKIRKCLSSETGANDRPSKNRAFFKVVCKIEIASFGETEWILQSFPNSLCNLSSFPFGCGKFEGVVFLGMSIRLNSGPLSEKMDSGTAKSAQNLSKALL